MIRFANTLDIRRDPAAVYAYLEDLEHVPDWNWAIARSERLTPGPTTVGTRFRLSRTSPRPGQEVLEVTGMEPGRRLDVAGPIGPFAANVSYELEPSAGGTRLTNAVELELPIPLGPVSNVVGGRVRSAVAENLEVLKAVLEGRA